MNQNCYSVRLLFRIPFIISCLCFSVRIEAQLAVNVFAPRIAGQRAIFPLALSNGFPSTIESARAVMFLLDSEDKVVGQGSRWIIGGDTNRIGLSAAATNIFHFVVPINGKAFVSQRLTVTTLKVSNNKSANPVTDLKVTYQAKP